MTKASVRLSERELKRRSSGGGRDLTGFWLLGGAAVITIVLIVLSLRPAQTALIDGVVEYKNLARGHSTAPQRYQQSPPVGGIHNPVWQNCGIYDQPLKNENMLHAMEHGAVWITY